MALKIKAIITNRFGNGGGDQMVHRQTGLYATANLRGRNGKGKASKKSAAKWLRERTLSLPWAGDSHELGQPREFVGVAPLWQSRNVIRSDQIKEFVVAILRIVADGIDAIRDPVELKFQIVHGAPRFSGEGEAQQAQPRGGWSGMAFRFEKGEWQRRG